ncbi:MAG: UPF0104 family protein, partial [Betaproteobacteria bacterium]|nr:UPF0104 family protein [Betaproteobacteria bacterium]
MEKTSRLKQLAKPALGLGLVALLLSQLQPAELLATLKSTDWQWALLGLVFACLANLACGLRWRKIVVQMGQPLGKGRALHLYFQGITANTVLPGGIIGGDIWRVLGLTKMGLSKTSATQSVVLDRAIGFWALSALALAAFCARLILGDRPWVQAPQALMAAYLLALLALSLAPALLWWMKAKWVRGMLVPAGISVGSQLLTITAFLCCLTAVRAEFSSLAVATLCAGIFLGAVVPASIGGFGSRELASV